MNNPKYPSPTPVPSFRPEQPKRTGALIATIITGLFAGMMMFGMVSEHAFPTEGEDLMPNIITTFIISALLFGLSLWLLVRPARRADSRMLKAFAKILCYLAMICFSVCGLIFCAPVYYAIFNPDIITPSIVYIIFVSVIALFFLSTLVKVFINIAKDVKGALANKSAEPNPSGC